jgi:hypothetical protein
LVRFCLTLVFAYDMCSGLIDVLRPLFHFLAGLVVASLAFIARVADGQNTNKPPTLAKKVTTKRPTAPCHLVPCGNPKSTMKKFSMCHQNSTHSTTLCLPESGLSNHLKIHNLDYCGVCTSSPTSAPTSSPTAKPVAESPAVTTEAPTSAPTSSPTTEDATED